MIEKKSWRHDPVFISSEYYTVLFNNEEQMDLENSTETKKVDIEKINLTKKSSSKSFYLIIQNEMKKIENKMEREAFIHVGFQ